MFVRGALRASEIIISQFQTPSRKRGGGPGVQARFRAKFTKSGEISGELLIKDPSLGGGVGSNKLSY